MENPINNSRSFHQVIKTRKNTDQELPHQNLISFHIKTQITKTHNCLLFISF